MSEILEALRQRRTDTEEREQAKRGKLLVTYRKLLGRDEASGRDLEKLFELARKLDKTDDQVELDLLVVQEVSALEQQIAELPTQQKELEALQEQLERLRAQWEELAREQERLTLAHAAKVSEVANLISTRSDVENLREYFTDVFASEGNVPRDWQPRGEIGAALRRVRAGENGTE